MAKGRKKRRFSVTEMIILLVAGAVFLVSAWQIGKWLYAGYVSGQVTEELAAEAVTIGTTEDPKEPVKQEVQEAEDVEAPEESDSTERIPISADFEALQKINPDIVAWIYSPGTRISYPVVQGNDNSYYLHRLVDGRKNTCGTLFVDCHNAESFTDGNTIIYGHHMKNGSMFASLEKYKEQSYYEEHPVMYLLTPEKSYRLVVFAGFVTAADSSVYTLQFPDEDRKSWVEKAIAQSDFQSDVQVDEDEAIVTLSTCDYTYSNARYVVLGVLR